ncbi:unnamed protein product [Amoebophrya sp. A25]|nr:unnamed protein product [Amoebophrya sp. A25]|eukprot:GSA25T00006549001.1
MLVNAFPKMGTLRLVGLLLAFVVCDVAAMAKQAAEQLTNIDPPGEGFTKQASEQLANTYSPAEGAASSYAETQHPRSSPGMQGLAVEVVTVCCGEEGANPEDERTSQQTAMPDVSASPVSASPVAPAPVWKPTPVSADKDRPQQTAMPDVSASPVAASPVAPAPVSKPTVSADKEEQKKALQAIARRVATLVDGGVEDPTTPAEDIQSAGQGLLAELNALQVADGAQALEKTQLKEQVEKALKDLHAKVVQNAKVVELTTALQNSQEVSFTGERTEVQHHVETSVNLLKEGSELIKTLERQRDVDLSDGTIAAERDTSLDQKIKDLRSAVHLAAWGLTNRAKTEVDKAEWALGMADTMVQKFEPPKEVDEDQPYRPESKLAQAEMLYDTLSDLAAEFISPAQNEQVPAVEGTAFLETREGTGLKRTEAGTAAGHRARKGVPPNFDGPQGVVRMIAAALQKIDPDSADAKTLFQNANSLQMRLPIAKASLEVLLAEVYYIRLPEVPHNFSGQLPFVSAGVKELRVNVKGTVNNAKTQLDTKWNEARKLVKTHCRDASASDAAPESTAVFPSCAEAKDVATKAAWGLALIIRHEVKTYEAELSDGNFNDETALTSMFSMFDKASDECEALTSGIGTEIGAEGATIGNLRSRVQVVLKRASQILQGRDMLRFLFGAKGMLTTLNDAGEEDRRRISGKQTLTDGSFAFKLETLEFSKVAKEVCLSRTDKLMKKLCDFAQQQKDKLRDEVNAIMEKKTTENCNSVSAIEKKAQGEPPGQDVCLIKDANGKTIGQIADTLKEIMDAWSRCTHLLRDSDQDPGLGEQQLQPVRHLLEKCTLAAASQSLKEGEEAVRNAEQQTDSTGTREQQENAIAAKRAELKRVYYPDLTEQGLAGVAASLRMTDETKQEIKKMRETQASLRTQISDILLQIDALPALAAAQAQDPQQQHKADAASAFLDASRPSRFVDVNNARRTLSSADQIIENDTTGHEVSLKSANHVVEGHANNGEGLQDHDNAFEFDSSHVIADLVQGMGIVMV